MERLKRSKIHPTCLYTYIPYTIIGIPFLAQTLSIYHHTNYMISQLNEIQKIYKIQPSSHTMKERNSSMIVPNTLHRLISLPATSQEPYPKAQISAGKAWRHALAKYLHISTHVLAIQTLTFPCQEPIIIIVEKETLD